jgi:hypothetical protein
MRAREVREASLVSEALLDQVDLQDSEV